MTELSIKSLLGNTNIDKISSEINRYGSRIERYIVLDSKYRNKSDVDTPGIYNFDIVVGRSLTSGAVNIHESLKNIISITALKPTIPYIEGYIDINHRRVCLGIKELSTQSYNINDMRSHFVFKTDDYYITNKLNVVNFIEENQTFKFNPPIRFLDHITLSVGNCKSLVSVPIDRDDAIITHGNPTVLTTTLPHEYSIGAKFYISIDKFVSSDDYLNNKFAKPILATSTGINTLTVLYDTSTLIGTQNVSIYYEDRRIVVNLIVECIKH